MSSFDRSSPSPSKRSRRRLAAWAAFGAVGLATGAVWASGFAQSTAANNSAVISPALTKGAPAVVTSPLASTVTAGPDLPIDWQGRWGSVATDATLFTVDLTGAQFTGKTYNVALLLANTSDLTEWASLQLEVERVDVAAAGNCAAADYDGTKNPLLLDADDEDSGVYYNALPGNAVYCIGVSSTPGDDIAGTFLRSAQDAAPSDWPKFITTVDRAS
jgi:hypothetical protein